MNGGSVYGKEEWEGKAGFVLGLLNLRTFLDEQVGNHVGRWTSTAGGLTWGVSSIWVVFQRVEGSVWIEWGGAG